MKILFRELTKLSDIVSEAQKSRRETVFTSPVRTKRLGNHSMVSSSELQSSGDGKTQETDPNMVCSRSLTELDPFGIQIKRGHCLSVTQ